MICQYPTTAPFFAFPIFCQHSHIALLFFAFVALRSRGHAILSAFTVRPSLQLLCVGPLVRLASVAPLLSIVSPPAFFVFSRKCVFSFLSFVRREFLLLLDHYTLI